MKKLKEYMNEYFELFDISVNGFYWGEHEEYMFISDELEDFENYIDELSVLDDILFIKKIDYEILN